MAFLGCSTHPSPKVLEKGLRVLKVTQTEAQFPFGIHPAPRTEQLRGRIPLCITR